MSADNFENETSVTAQFGGAICTTPPPYAAIIVAGGKGMRAGQAVPKQFAAWHGKPVLRHSAETFARAGAETIVVAIPAEYRAEADAALSGIRGVICVDGGNERQDSVARALAALPAETPPFVLIHDAARPDLPQNVIARVLEALNEAEGAIPVLPVVDSLVFDQAGQMAGSAPREALRRVQTPQGFRTEAIIAAHKAWHERGGETVPAGDDAQVLAANGGTVALVAGDERLKKLTFAQDFMEDSTAPRCNPHSRISPVPVRVGTGFDVHRLLKGEKLWLCGVEIAHSHGLSGHSDADVALHALTDALLGAVGAGDIGQHFPPSDPQWRGASSDQFVCHAMGLVNARGYVIGNVDLTIICEAPKIGLHREAMRARLAELLGTAIDQISVKATTSEGLGFTGRREGIAAQASVSIMHV